MVIRLGLLRRAASLTVALPLVCCSGERQHAPMAAIDPPVGDAAAETGADATIEGGDGKVTRSDIMSVSTFNNWEAETHLAIAPDGTMFVTWIALDLGGSRTIAYSVSRDGGATWKKPTLVPTSVEIGAAAGDPSIAVDSKGAFHVAWLELPSSGPRRVMTAKWIEVGDGFSIPVEVSDPSAPSTSLDKPWIVALDDGSLLVTFGSESGSALTVAKSADGVVFERRTVQPDGTLRNVAFPCAAGEKVGLTYLIPGGAELVISNDRGRTWSKPTRVDKDGAALEPPSCVAAGSDVWIAYGTGGGSVTAKETPLLDAVWIAHATDGAIVARDRATPLGPKYMLPVLARHEGRFALGYYTGAAKGSKGSFSVAFSSDARAFGSPLAVSTISLINQRGGFEWLGDYAGMSSFGGALFVVYADNASISGAAISHIRAARIAAGGT